jgi:hypothetical protein
MTESNGNNSKRPSIENPLVDSTSVVAGLSPRASKKPRSSERKEEDGIPLPEVTQADLITLTSHPDAFGVDPIPISWGHPDPAVRGPVICTVRHSAQRNAIGAHQGSYCVYTGLAVAAGKLDPSYVPNLSLTSPVFQIGPYPSWSDPKKISALDPFGHLTTDAYGDWLEKGWDIRPTIVSASEQTLVFRSRRGKTC